MTAKDFMIGDWVHSLKIDEDTQITDIETDVEDVFWLYVRKPFGRQFMNEIQPIPLTEEILLKHFPKPEEGVVWCPSPIASLQPTKFHFDIAKGGLYMTIPNLRYVHELQHVLKIAGINKEIKL